MISFLSKSVFFRGTIVLSLLFAAVFSHAETAREPKKIKGKASAPSSQSHDGGTNAAPAKSTAAKTAAEISAEKSLYQEILQVLHERYADPSVLSPPKLDDAAVSGILNSLRGSARLVETDTAPSKSTPTVAAVNSMSVITPFIGYLRVRRLEEGTGKQTADEIKRLIQQEHVTGLILDLRFADGQNLSEVPATASVFFSDDRPLFTVQRGSGAQAYSTTPSGFSTDAPLAILVNHETQGAAEALAASLQDQGRALLIGGSPTAGQTFETSDIKLSNGKTLRFASGKLTLSHGGEVFLKNIKPDINVPSFDFKVEKEIYEQPFQPPEFLAEARYFSEAILTGRQMAPPIPPMNKGKNKNKNEPKEPASNRDQVLQRAIDLLKAISSLELQG